MDNQLPVALAQWLVAHGADAVHVPNLGPAPVPDTGIWARAAAEDRIVVSKDEDFFHPANRTGDTGRCSGSPFFGVTQRRKDAKGRRLSVHFFAPLREASLNSGTPSETEALRGAWACSRMGSPSAADWRIEKYPADCAK